MLFFFYLKVLLYQSTLYKCQCRIFDLIIFILLLVFPMPFMRVKNKRRGISLRLVYLDLLFIGLSN